MLVACGRVLALSCGWGRLNNALFSYMAVAEVSSQHGCVGSNILYFAFRGFRSLSLSLSLSLSSLTVATTDLMNLGPLLQAPASSTTTRW